MPCAATMAVGNRAAEALISRPPVGGLERQESHCHQGPASWHTAAGGRREGEPWRSEEEAGVCQGPGYGDEDTAGRHALRETRAGVFHREKMLSKTWRLPRGGARVLPPACRGPAPPRGQLPGPDPAGRARGPHALVPQPTPLRHGVTGAARLVPAVIISACYTEMS